ncbi:unnamed protein product [Mesocestoides corti]|uniref:Uncharacterized protein n=1 Tax=Mesocestoides corti TaxID=53468 RepID=A0A0R3UCN1_MESCO|nr:unnamed protein product [Mesocestoides corti]
MAEYKQCTSGYFEIHARDSGDSRLSTPHLPQVDMVRRLGMPSEQDHSGGLPDSPSVDQATPAIARRPSHHRYARDEVRYRSEIREEAVKEALQKEPSLCLESLRPSKRRQPTPSVPEPGPSHARSESESETSLDTSTSRQCLAVPNSSACCHAFSLATLML